MVLGLDNLIIFVFAIIVWFFCFVVSSKKMLEGEK